MIGPASWDYIQSLKGMFLGDKSAPPPPPTCLQSLTQLTSDVSYENKEDKAIQISQFLKNQKEKLIGELLTDPDQIKTCKEIAHHLSQIDPKVFTSCKRSLKIAQKIAHLLKENDMEGLLKFTREERKKAGDMWLIDQNLVSTTERFCDLMVPQDMKKIRAIPHREVRLRVLANSMNRHRISPDELNLSAEERAGINPYLTQAQQPLVIKKAKESARDLALRREMVTEASIDQKNLLSGVSIEELRGIRECYDHPLMRQIVKDVRMGQWEHLIRLAKKRPEVPIFNILKAAYCQGKLGGQHPSHVGIDNLVSAYIFLRPALDGQAYKIYHFDEVAQHPEIWEDISTRWNIDDIPKNQRYFILVEREQYSKEAQVLMDSLHDIDDRQHNVAGGLRYYTDKGWALGAAGLIRSDKLLDGHPPIFGRRLRPFAARFNNLLQGCVDFALLEPMDKHPTELHGASVEKSGNMSLAHDGYHGVVAAERIWKYPELLSIGQKIQELFDNKKIPRFSKNVRMVATIESFYAVLSVRPAIRGLPTADDWVRFLLYETITAIQDGEAYYSQESSFENIAITIGKIFNRQCQDYTILAFGVPPPKINDLVPTLNKYLNSLAMHFYTIGNGLQCEEIKAEESKD